MRKKFDLVHQTISPRERVGSGDETSNRRATFVPSARTLSSASSLCLEINCESMTLREYDQIADQRVACGQSGCEGGR